MRFLLSPQHQRLLDEIEKRRPELDRSAEEYQKDKERQQVRLKVKEFEDYLAARPGDVAKALSRRISAGDAGMPFLVIDTIFATATTGSERGQKADLPSAIEQAKDQLWFQCRHLGGDAVLFADFKLEEGAISYTSGAAVAFNVMAALINVASRGRSTPIGSLETEVTRKTMTVFARGTAVKLLPTGTAVSPALYEQFDTRWLDMRLPPGVTDPRQPEPGPTE